MWTKNPLSLFRVLPLIGLICLGILTSESKAQFSFSIKSNSGLDSLSADFGYRIGRIQPYLGFSNATYTLEDEPAIYGDYFIEDSVEHASTSFVLSLGLRVAFSDGQLRPYAFGQADKHFYILDNDGSDEEHDEFFEKLFSPFVLGAGFGAEYSVSQYFAVFGEYGFQMTFLNVEQKMTVGDEDSGQEEQRIDRTHNSFSSSLNGSAGIRFYF